MIHGAVLESRDLESKQGFNLYAYIVRDPSVSEGLINNLSHENADAFRADKLKVVVLTVIADRNGFPAGHAHFSGLPHGLYNGQEISCFDLISAALTDNAIEDACLTLDSMSAKLT